MDLRDAGVMVLSVAILVASSLLVSFGVLWLSGWIVVSVFAGAMSGLMAASAFEGMIVAAGRIRKRRRERPNDRIDRCAEGPERQEK